MKKILIAACALIACATSLSAQSLYWDSNGTTAGAGGTPVGTWGNDSFWSTASDGTATPGAWTSGATAIFSAGTDSTGAVTITVGSPQTVGRIVVEEGTPTFNGSTLTLNGAATIEVASGRTAILGNTILAGSAGLTKEGAGTLQMNGVAHTYTGNTTVKAGAIRIGATTTVFGSLVNIGTVVMDGGNLDTIATRTLINPLNIRQNMTFSKDAGSTTRTVTFTNSLVTSPGVTVTLRNPGTAIASLRFTGGSTNDANWILGNPGDGLTQLQWMGNTNWPDQIINGTISGPGMVRRTSTVGGNGGSTILNGDNTYMGGTENNGGMIGFGRSSTGNPVMSGPIGSGPLTFLDDTVIGMFASGGARTVGNNVFFKEIAFDLQIPGSHDLTMTGSMTFSNTARTIVVSSTGLTTFSGEMSGGAVITKAGAGTLALSGNNVNTGGIVVSDGKLLVNNVAGSGTGSGAVTVNAGAILGGTGSIGGSATVGGTVAPGTSGAGTLSFTGGVDLSAATYSWDLVANSITAGVFDKIAVNGGNVTLGGSSVLALNFTGSATFPNSSSAFWQSARSWTVVQVSGGSNPGSSNFASITGTNGITSGTFSTSVDGSGNVILSYAPASIVTPQPAITSITGTGTSKTITWTSVLGATYTLQSTLDLTATPAWSDVSSVVAPGSAASITDSNATSNIKFYRVRTP